MESANNITMTAPKILIATLSVCLLSAIGLFLYSEYQLSRHSPATASHSSMSPTASLSTPSSNKNIAAPNQTSTVTNDASVNTAEVQPDASLPIPARQLKKLIAEEKNTASLDDKIAAANQAIAQLDKLVDNNAQDQQPDSLAETKLPAPGDTKNEELDQRIQRLRQHLQQ